MLVTDKERTTPKSNLHVFLQRSFNKFLICNQKDGGLSLNASVYGKKSALLILICYLW